MFQGKILKEVLHDQEKRIISSKWLAVACRRKILVYIHQL